MVKIPRRGVDLNEVKRSVKPRRAPDSTWTTVAVVMGREDGTFTVAWGKPWSRFDGLEGTWPSLREAMRSVERTVHGSIVWRSAEPRLWEGRAQSETARADRN